MDQITLQVLLGHNPWLLDKNAWQATITSHLPERYIPRHLVSPLECTNNKINLVIGPRQSGKSTLIWHFLSTLSQPFLLINCEEASSRELCKSPALFLTSIKDVADPLPGLLFEEIQHLPEAGLFLKGLVDLKPDVPIFVTGSASYHLRSKTRESLAGRAVRHYLLPFGMTELWPRDLPKLISEEKAVANWKELLIWGGYPEVFLNQNKQAILAQLVEAFVLRDASDLYRIKRPDAFRKLLSLAASQIGNLVNFSNWAENAGISVNTVIEYINLMAESHLVKLVPPFVGGKRAEVTSAPKIFFFDNGLRNLLFGGFTPENQRADFGALTENLVFAELCKYTNPLLDSILYWRSSSGAEVDFIIRTTGQLIAVEVKAGSLKRPKISRSLRSFITAYRPDKVFVFNESLVASSKIEGVDVIFDRLINIPSRIGSSKI
jgi:predicted AAA+ superfamily ATPase